jgi:hypothetical protein
MPSNGLALPILLAQKEVLRNAAPQFKLTPAGFLDYVLNQNKPAILSKTIDDGSGYIRDVKVRFKKRFKTGMSSDADDCSINSTSPYYEQTMPTLLFRKQSLWFDWNTIETFTTDALAMQAAGKPATQVMTEVIDAMTSALNGLLGDINNDLLDDQVASFGVNVVAGNNSARAVNFPLNTTNNPLDSGMTRVMADAMANEVMLNGSSIVGAGIINNFYLQQAQKGLDQSGVDTSRVSLPKFFYDPYTATKFGANEFGLFEKDAVQFINICKFQGPKTKRWGNSEFGTITWPIMDSLGGGQGLRTLEFDFQAREVDCPQEGVVLANDQDYGGANTINTGRGLQFDIMCHYKTVNIPSDAYMVGDRLYQVNGTFRYQATNT